MNNQIIRLSRFVFLSLLGVLILTGGAKCYPFGSQIDLTGNLMDASAARRMIESAILVALASNSVTSPDETTVQDRVLTGMLISSPIHHPGARYCRAQVHLCRDIILFAGSDAYRCSEENGRQTCDLLQGAMAPLVCEFTPNTCLQDSDEDNGNILGLPAKR